MLNAHPFPPLMIRGHSLLPIVQGGMGVGSSAHRLAGSVAREGLNSGSKVARRWIVMLFSAMVHQYYR
jgi:hypothetical protein